MRAVLTIDWRPGMLAANGARPGSRRGRSASGTAPFDATLTVKVDGTTVKNYTEKAAFDADYAQQLVNISQLAQQAIG